jgi:hypothetical protein
MFMPQLWHQNQTPAGETNQFPQMISIQQQAERQTEPASRVAGYWNEGIKASYNVSDELYRFPHCRRLSPGSFGAVVTFKADGIARGTSALVSTGDNKSNSVLSRTGQRPTFHSIGAVLPTFILHHNSES